MADNHYFVEFTNYDSALKFQERYKFLLGKYQRLSEDLAKLKHEKLSELNKFLVISNQLNNELTDFNKLMPKAKKPAPKENAEEVKARRVKRRVKKLKKIKKAGFKPAKKSLSELKKDLEQIKKDLTQM